MNRLSSITLASWLILLISAVSFGTRIQALSLIHAQDFTSNDSLSAPGIVHNVSFQIPAGGHPVVPSDFIRIDLPNFTAVTAPTGGSGWTGVPTFGVSATTAYITNVSVPAGQFVTISGITATNPAVLGQFNVDIDTASDLAGTIIYDSASIFTSTIKGTVTASVTIPSPSATLTVNGYTSPGAFVSVFINSVLAGTTTAASDGTYSETISGLTPANVVVTVHATDTSNIQTADVSFNILLLSGTHHTVSDVLIPPTIEVSNSPIYQGGVVTFTGSATPGSQVAVYIDPGPAYQQLVNVPPSGNWQLNFDTDVFPLVTGSHSVYAIQIQGSLQSGLSTTANFVVNDCLSGDSDCDGTVDPVTPTTQLAAPSVSTNLGPQNDWFSTTTAVFTWTTPTGAVGFNYTFQKGSAKPLTASNLGNGTTLDVSNLTDGIYYFQIAAIDSNGQLGKPVTYILKIDTSAPTNLQVSISPTSPVSSLPIVTFGATDTGSGVVKYEIKLDGGAFQEVDSPYQIPQLTAGSHTITIKAYDAAGNYTESSLDFTTVELITPTITSPAPGTTLAIGQPFVVTGTATPGSTVQIFINGELVTTVLANAEGNFSAQISNLFGAGNYNIWATSSNQGGISSSQSTVLGIVISGELLQVFGVLMPSWVMLCCCCSSSLLLLLLLLIFLLKKRRQKEELRNTRVF